MSPPATLALQPRMLVRLWKTSVCAFQSNCCDGPVHSVAGPPRARRSCHTITSRSGSG